MISSSMTYRFSKKVLASLFVFGSLITANVVVLPLSFAATKPATPIKVMGKAQFVLQGTVTAVTAGSLTLHVVKTSKNAKLFDSKDKTITVSSKTTLTKNTKNIPLSQIKSGDTVKVFGIFDRKSGAITLTRWIKVVQK